MKYWITTCLFIFYGLSVPAQQKGGAYAIKNYEDSVASSFAYAVKDIKHQLSKVLPAKDRQLLARVNVKLDTSYFGLQCNSNSQDRTVTINWGVFKTLNRDLLAYQIAQTEQFTTDLFKMLSQTDFGRPNYYRFYNSYLRKISDSIDVVRSAELSDEDLGEIDTLQQTSAFRWVYKRRVVFIFLHEFYHQVQNYAAVVERLERRHLKAAEKAAVLLQLEKDADAYAERMAAKLRIVPVNFTEVVHILGLLKDNKNQTEVDLLKRKQAFVALLSKGCKVNLASLDYDCAALKREVALDKKDWENSIKTYQADLSLYQHRASAGDDPKRLFSLGYIYLSRNTIAPKNLDSALYYFSRASDRWAELKKQSKSPLYSSLGDELAALITAELLEKYRKDQQCIRYYRRASEIAAYMPEDFYEHILSRLNH